MHVVVIGAGPAGLMAAEVAAAAGNTVAVYDQHRSPARKFVLAGRGGLNITHSEPLENLLGRYGPERQHLEPAVRAFTPNRLRAWCAELGHETFEGSSGRVFPAEFRAVPLLRSWLARLEALGVTFHPGHRWMGWRNTNPAFEAADGTVTVGADRTVLALGGASWPRVGGDGSWVDLLEDKGVEVRPLQAANCGVQVAWSAVMVDRFAGEPLKNVAVAVDSHVVRGDPIVTSTGLEGGPIYAHSRRIRHQLAQGEPAVTVDLFPDLTVEVLTQRLIDTRRRDQSVSKWFRRCGISPVAASLMREATNNELPSELRDLAMLAKATPVAVTAMASIDRAISSAGGVAWSELDEHFQLRKLPGVYAIGEMLDWEAPTGGYLLQACFSTARWAANAL